MLYVKEKTVTCRPAARIAATGTAEGARKGRKGRRGAWPRRSFRPVACDLRDGRRYFLTNFLLMREPSLAVATTMYMPRPRLAVLTYCDMRDDETSFPPTVYMRSEAMSPYTISALSSWYMSKPDRPAAVPVMPELMSL